MPKLKHNLDWDILCQLSKYQSYSWGSGGRGWYKLKVKPTWDKMSKLKHNLDWYIPLQCQSTKAMAGVVAVGTNLK